MKNASVLMILLWTGAASSAGGNDPLDPGVPLCVSQATSFDSRAVSCSIPPGASQRYRLDVNFSGGHDDTVAALIPRLDGTLLECEAGSKLRLIGEDGDVSLFCVFSTPNRSTERHVFEASVSFSHAQYVSYAFSPG